MLQLITLGYYLLLAIFALIALFIVFHIVRYSLSRTAALLMLVLFLSVFGILMFTNMIIFSSIDFSQIFPVFFSSNL